MLFCGKVQRLKKIGNFADIDYGKLCLFGRILFFEVCEPLFGAERP